MFQDATEKHSTLTKYTPPKDGKFEVLFPVSLPDEGTFDWLDMLLEQRPEFTELSDRAILGLCEKSGLWRPKGYGHTARVSNDKPELGFGIPALDDMSVRRILQQVGPIVQRNFIVMEVKANLMKADRAEALARWSAPHFKKVAHVIVGEPKSDFKKRTSALMLEAKQEASNIEFRKKKVEERRLKLVERRQREFDRAKRNAERLVKRRIAEEKKKAAEELQKKREEEKNEKAQGEEKAEETNKDGKKEDGAEEKERVAEEQKEEEAGEKKKEVEGEAQHDGK